MKNVQKIGGVAALGHAATLVVGMVLSLTLMFPLLDAAPDQTLNFSVKPLGPHNTVDLDR